jgi:hypothetical protein
MSLSFSDAYAQIKTLENTGQITLPKPRETVLVGTIDPKAGTFKWAVPTVDQTTVIPPHPPVRTNTIISHTVGVVATKAVDLQLEFAVIPVKPVNEPVAARRTSRKPVAAARVVPAGIAGGVLGESNGGVKIYGFPTVVSAADHITLDAGLVCSTTFDDPTTTPAVSRFSLTIDIPGHDPIDVELFILRPPVVGMGAFTVPALPMTIVYAPQQGKLAKNSASYSDTESFTRTLTVSASSSTNTKTMQAYKPEDLIGKVAGAIGAVIAVVGTGGAAGAGGASVAGAFAELGSALFGKAKDDVGSTADAAKQVQSELSLVSTILGGFDGSPTTSDGGSITTQQDQSLSVSLQTMTSYGSAAGLGPGVGDRIVYLKDVKLVWMAVNGEVGIVVLGYGGIGASSAKDLVDEHASLAAGNPPRLGLDAKTIEALLALDPLVPPTKPALTVRPLPSPIVPPRYVPADPAERQGSGSSGSGDVWQVTVDTTNDAKQTTTTAQTTITDDKPGWLDVLFGDDNTETITTTTLTTTHSEDDKTESKLTATITMVTADANDAYDVKCFYDRTFGGYVVLDAKSPLLQGGLIVAKPVAARMVVGR